MNTRPEASENLRFYLARWSWDPVESHDHLLPRKVLQINQHRPDTQSGSKASRCFTRVLTHWETSDCEPSAHNLTSANVPSSQAKTSPGREK